MYIQYQACHHPSSIYSPAIHCLIFIGVAGSFILPHAALILHFLSSIQEPHLHILFGACIFISFVQIIFNKWLKRWIFSAKVITILTYCCKQKKQDKRSTDFFAVKTRPFYWCLMSPRKSMVSVAHDCVIGDVIYLQSRLRD